MPKKNKKKTLNSAKVKQQSKEAKLWQEQVVKLSDGTQKKEKKAVNPDQVALNQAYQDLINSGNVAAPPGEPRPGPSSAPQPGLSSAPQPGPYPALKAGPSSAPPQPPPPPPPGSLPSAGPAPTASSLEATLSALTEAFKEGKPVPKEALSGAEEALSALTEAFKEGKPVPKGAEEALKAATKEALEAASAVDPEALEALEAWNAAIAAGKEPGLPKGTPKAFEKAANKGAATTKAAKGACANPLWDAETEAKIDRNIEEAGKITQKDRSKDNDKLYQKCTEPACTSKKPKNPWKPRARNMHPTEDLSLLGYIWWTEEELLDRADQMQLLASLEYTYKEFRNASRACSHYVDGKDDIFSSNKHLYLPGRKQLEMARFKLRQARESRAITPNKNDITRMCKCNTYRAMSRTKKEDWASEKNKDIRPFQNPSDPLLDIYIRDVFWVRGVYIEKIDIGFEPRNPTKTDDDGFCMVCTFPQIREAVHKGDSYQDEATRYQQLAMKAGKLKPQRCGECREKGETSSEGKPVASVMSQILFTVLNLDNLAESLDVHKKRWHRQDEKLREKLELKAMKEQRELTQQEVKRIEHAQDFRIQKGFKEFVRDLWRKTVSDCIEEVSENWLKLCEKQIEDADYDLNVTGDLMSSYRHEDADAPLPTLDKNLVDVMTISEDLWKKLETNAGFRQEALDGGSEWLKMTLMKVVMNDINDQRMKEMTFFLNSVKSRNDRHKIKRQDLEEMKRFMKGRTEDQVDRIMTNMKMRLEAAKEWADKMKEHAEEEKEGN